MQHFTANFQTRLALPDFDPTLYKADREGVQAFAEQLDGLLGVPGPQSRAVNFFVVLSDHTLDQVTNLFALIHKGWSHLSFVGGASSSSLQTSEFSPLWGRRRAEDSDAEFEHKANAFTENFEGKLTYLQRVTGERTAHVIGVQLVRPGARRETVLTFLYRFLNLCAWVEQHLDTRLSSPQRLKLGTFDAITKHRERGIPAPPPRESARPRLPRGSAPRRAAASAPAPSWSPPNLPGVAVSDISDSEVDEDGSAPDDEHEDQ